MEIVGWLAAICFILSAIPQAWQSYRDGHSDGLNNYFLGLWAAGDIFTFIYTWPLYKLPLTVNYVLNIICVVIVIRYKLWPRVL